MEPSRMPYNLRPRDRKVDYSYRRPKRVTREESIRKEEEEIQVQLDDPIRQEEIEDQYERLCKKYYLEKLFPYPLMAMKHYNNDRKEEEQFKVTDHVRDISMWCGKVGGFHALHFRARPKRVGEILPNSSDEVPTVDFFALIHRMPNDEVHVSYCERNPNPNPPEKGIQMSEINELFESHDTMCPFREDLKDCEVPF
ncbi:hypothetical protein AAHE18_06G156600 [Arachis hypogaea]